MPRTISAGSSSSSALLLTGDHVMHGSTVVIRPPDGDLHQYLASLARCVTLSRPSACWRPGTGG